MTDAICRRGGAEGLSAKRSTEYFRKGCNPLAKTGRSKLQNERAILNQQIMKAVRMRAGAENLLRATNNNKVREQVLLELSFVNSNLQVLKEELEGLNISVEVYQHTEQNFSIPLIPLGLKETKELDFAIAFKDFILEHYSEDGPDYENEIADFMDLRQACRTPSRDEAGIELMINYFNQLGFVENRFFPSGRQTGIVFTWYDCFTGVPVSQQNIALEKASILFNIGALYTQIGTRCNRQTQTGLEDAVYAFQKAAGILNYLKETFTHTPSYDMSPAMLSVLVKMMLAEAQECFFEKISLPGIRNEFFTLVRIAQETVKVSDVYGQIFSAMSQEPIKDNIPYSWSIMAQVKAEYYKALTHYFVATLLIDHHLNASDDEDKQEKALSQLYDHMPHGISALTILKDNMQRTQQENSTSSDNMENSMRIQGKTHLRRAVICHEEAMRVSGLCRKLRNIEMLQEILTVAHKRSLQKYSEHQKEDDFLNLIEAPDIVGKTDYKAEICVPELSKVKVTDFFHRLGPMPLFSAKQRWSAPRTLDITAEDVELGFTLKGGTPVQVHCLDPLCSAAERGLKEGDYIVAVEGKDCKWLGVSEIISMFKDVGEKGLEIQVISSQELTTCLHNKSATYSVGMERAYSTLGLAINEDKNDKSKKITKKLSFLSWGVKARPKSVSTLCLPTTHKGLDQRLGASFANMDSESSLY